VTTPESYDAILAELRESGRRLSDATRESLAAEAFAVTARYDAAIARWFQEKREDFPPLLVRAYERMLELPYGENPHQRAAYYTQAGARTHLLSMVSQLGGKQLSFNNLLDLNAARQLLSEFQVPACVIVKHNNPCGVALGLDVVEAYRRAFEGDPLSAYGGVVCLNRRVEGVLAEALVGQFIEVLFAPGYDADALEVLQAKPNMRILDDREQRAESALEADLRQVSGGVLVQDRDSGLEQREEMEVVSARPPTETEWSEALFAWKVCKHVRSNAIVLSSGLQTVGIGAGQMSRVDAVKISLEKARAFWDAHGGAEGEDVAMASDAFFPFPDSAELATAAGVGVIIEPGGSIRDQQVIEAVDKAGAAMIFTSRRHFRH
jgi:phosphoribosylaminoimidazolecarboxamide formyltransferase/IMP cyclohydrolase